MDTVNINDYSTNNWERFTFNYQFETGEETKNDFGTPTPTDETASNPQSENIRRNKDVSYFPPAYGVFSGDIPTEASSQYHSNENFDYSANISNVNSIINGNEGIPYQQTGGLNNTGVLASTSIMNGVYGTQDYENVSYYNDGSIGTIKIPELGLNVKVYEGETLDSMKKGVGHFEFTSIWNGNVGIAGHNRGSSDYFNGIWNLQNGDEIIYETKYGERVYEVFSKEKISDTDYSLLSWSNDNIITLITCVENNSSKRWAVQAAEK